MNEHEIIAAEIFEKYHLDFQTATRAGGWTNAVWLNGEFALRLSFKKDSDRIRREVELSKYFPTTVGYPSNIATGVTNGYEWSISKRIAGVPLSDVWDSLGWQERALAVRQIVDIVKSVHMVEVNQVDTLSSKEAWYTSFSPEQSSSDIKRYVQSKILTAIQGEILQNILACFYSKHFSAAQVLNHGDITMDNILWHDGNIVSLMDFEHSVISPAEIDLHSILNLAFLTQNSNYILADHNEDIIRYRQNVMNTLKPMLSHPDCCDLLIGYAVLFCFRFIDFWIENPEKPLEHLDVYHRLVSLSDGQRGYIGKLFI